MIVLGLYIILEFGNVNTTNVMNSCSPEKLFAVLPPQREQRDALPRMAVSVKAEVAYLDLGTSYKTHSSFLHNVCLRRGEGAQQLGMRTTILSAGTTQEARRLIYLVA